MKAAVILAYGGSDVFRYQDHPDPSPGPGQVLVRIAAASINPVDLLERAGMLKEWKPLAFPGILGWDMAGIVVQAGPGVEGFRTGDRVFAWTFGTYAELCVVDVSVLAKVPDAVDLIDAATLPLAGTTGSQLIAVSSGLQPGQTVLISGALGSVGRAAVCTAKDRGAHVIAGVRSGDLDAAKKTGADRAVALDDEAAFASLEQVDVVANTVRGETASRLLAKVKSGGVFASATGLPEESAAFPSVQVKSFVSKQDPATLAFLAKAAELGKLQIPIAGKLPLSDAREAHERMQQGVNGKILLIP